MATEEQLPPACAFAIAVLKDYIQNPQMVPEEAIEATQQHIATCPRCVQEKDTLPGASPSTKRRTRRDTTGTSGKLSAQTKPTTKLPAPKKPTASAKTSSASSQTKKQATPAAQKPKTSSAKTPTAIPQWASAMQPPTSLPAISDTSIVTIVADGSGTNGHQAPHDEGLPEECLRCRQLLPDYAEALENGHNVDSLYADVQSHLQNCTSDCLLVLELCREIIKEERVRRYPLVENPIGIIQWQLIGFFKRGQVPVTSTALAYGTLILLLLFTLAGGTLGYFFNTFLHQSTSATTTTLPDGVGFSDGLKVFDACNTEIFQHKREAARILQQGSEINRAQEQFSSAIRSAQKDTAGCNGAEAVIYQENLRVRQSGRAFSTLIVSFDSGPGNATQPAQANRGLLYGAYTQELIGAAISQLQYNEEQMNTSDAPLLYIVLANTTGTDAGALQIAQHIAQLTEADGYQNLGLLARGEHPLLGVLGLGPAALTQIVLPTLCQTGIPLLAPTATGRYIIDQLNTTSRYQHCTPGFGFVRFSSDDITQSELAAEHIYTKLNKQHAAVFSDPSDPSSQAMAQSFIERSTTYKGAQVVARELVITAPWQGTDEREMTERESIQTALQDAMRVNPRPDVIFATLPTQEITLLGEEIARLPQDQQPALVVGGEFIQSATLQKLVPWARQNQLTPPLMYVVQSAVSRPPGNDDWQKQFYGKFCRTFATPALPCSNTSALDYRALLFADGVQAFLKALHADSEDKTTPARDKLVQQFNTIQFTGVSGPITLQKQNNVILNPTTRPVFLSVQQDGGVHIASS